MFSRRTGWERSANALALAVEARRAAGAPFADLTESNPTRCGLLHPEAALREAIAPAGSTQYAPEPLGLLNARRAVLGTLPAGLSVEQVALTASTSEAYGLLFKLLCDPGDEVLAPHPGYPLFELLGGAEAVAVAPYPLAFDGTWRLDLEPLAAAGPRTRAVVCVSPGNPTGAFLKRGEAQRLAELCAARGWALIVDEVFSAYGVGADSERLGSVLELPELPCLTFALGGLSKLACLPQLKLSWLAVAGPPALREEALGRLELLLDCALSVATPVQLALPRLLELGATLRPRVQERLARNRAALLAARSQASTWSLLPSEGGWSAVLRLRQEPGELATCLEALQRGCLVHPGHFFDFPSGQHLVLSLLPEPAVFDAGLAALLPAL